MGTYNYPVAAEVPLDPGTTDPVLSVARPGAGGYASSTPSPSSFSGSSAVLFSTMGLSAVTAIGGAITQASAARAQSSYEAAIAHANARIARIQADQAIATGDIESSRRVTRAATEAGTLRAAQGSSGTDVNSGSNVLVRNSIESVGAMDALTIRTNAARQAWGYETEAIQDTFKGQFAELSGKSTATQSYLSGGLQAIEGPLAIESGYLRWSRYMGGGGGGQASRLPFNLSTNS